MSFSESAQDVSPLSGFYGWTDTLKGVYYGPGSLESSLPQFLVQDVDVVEGNENESGGGWPIGTTLQPSHKLVETFPDVDVRVLVCLTNDLLI